MSDSATELDLKLEQAAHHFIQNKKKHTDPLKAATIQQEIMDEISGQLIKDVPSKLLFMYGNQLSEKLRTEIEEAGQNHELSKIKIEILENAMRMKAVDYLRDVVPINANIAQHALFSANPRSKQVLSTAHGVKSVHIKNTTGAALTTYEARVMGAIQSIWFKQNDNGKPTLSLKYADIISELGLTDGSANYKRIQESLLRLKDVEVTLTQFQRSKNAEYEEIAFTRLIDQITFRRKVGTTSHYQYKFEIKLPDWLVEANREGNLFDVSLILMNDLKSYLAQGLYWLVSSYPEDKEVDIELSVLAGHFHFLDNNQPIMPVYKIIERIKEACEELRSVGFIDHYEIHGKKQGLENRFLTLSKNRMFLSSNEKVIAIPEQLELFKD
ncbi:replication initiator protein A [Paenibacillus hunanensis]|uniref:replication initiator protein A n=1 Tax=Paenibacillus hunanensis TaxID=539262 RepID=UPI00202679CB|nr:replication initiator protein A [Paenibacillus hunanensis]MCL9662060.1 replication initiator protein A [Paenibacillus hunanensis]